jgi:hypothetical protein
MRVVRQLSFIGLVSLAACAEGVTEQENDLEPGNVDQVGNEATEDESSADDSELRWRPRRDAGTSVDAGRDAGSTSTGSDAGSTNPGSDAGSTNPGSDAGSTNPGSDAGRSDAGSSSDAGRDAGSSSDAGRDAGRDAGSSNDSGTTTPSNDAGSSSGVWRPFNAQSPWNTLIPSNPPLAPDSAALISDLRTSSQYGQNLDVNIAEFSIPLFYATATTPMVDVLAELGGIGFSGNDGSNAHALVPIPAGAAPDPMSDHHIAIIDRAKNLEWGMWNARNESGRWSCSLGATADLSGDGLRPYKPTNPTWYTSHGARACGFPLIAGLIRTEEIDAGRIDHALVIAYPHIRAGLYMSPASTAQARIGDDSIQSRGIPCGGRIQLDPNLNLDSLGLSRAGRIIAEALQRYGAYVGDYSGAISIYAENAPAAQTHWRGVLDTYVFLNKLDLSRLRVLQYGQVTDDGNGG